MGGLESLLATLDQGLTLVYEPFAALHLPQFLLSRAKVPALALTLLPLFLFGFGALLYCQVHLGGGDPELGRGIYLAQDVHGFIFGEVEVIEHRLETRAHMLLLPQLLLELLFCLSYLLLVYVEGHQVDLYRSWNLPLQHI